jgi:large subunit ribosomal protein L25
MAETHSFSAALRDRAGKGSARAARRAGRIPAVIYGAKEEPVSITVDRLALELAVLDPHFFTVLLDLDVSGTKHRVLPRDVQFHPVTDAPLHVDFLRFDPNRLVTVDVPVEFVNEEEAPGLKRGGVLNIVRHEVEVSCRADNIPQTFTIDLTGYDIGDSAHASTIPLPDGVTFTISDRDFTIATIAAPTVQREETEEEGEGEEAAAEGETETEKEEESGEEE